MSVPGESIARRGVGKSPRGGAPRATTVGSRRAKRRPPRSVPWSPRRPPLRFHHTRSPRRTTAASSMWTVADMPGRIRFWKFSASANRIRTGRALHEFPDEVSLSRCRAGRARTQTWCPPKCSRPSLGKVFSGIPSSVMRRGYRPGRGPSGPPGDWPRPKCCRSRERDDGKERLLHRQRLAELDGPPADDPPCGARIRQWLRLSGAERSRRLGLIDPTLHRLEPGAAAMSGCNWAGLGLDHCGVGAAQGLAALLEPDAGLFELKFAGEHLGARWRRSRRAEATLELGRRLSIALSARLSRSCTGTSPEAASRWREPAVRRRQPRVFLQARPAQGPALVPRRAIPAPSGGSARASGPRPLPPAPPARPRLAVHFAVE